LVRGRLGDPKLGVHNGLQVTVIVSTTLTPVDSGAAVAAKKRPRAVGPRAPLRSAAASAPGRLPFDCSVSMQK
jgi:hypothetical protein